MDDHYSPREVLIVHMEECGVREALRNMCMIAVNKRAALRDAKKDFSEFLRELIQAEAGARYLASGTRQPASYYINGLSAFFERWGLGYVLI